jgi:predicted amidophosphoribosyltransferase
MAGVRRVMDRTCIVCGHNLGPYGRICDKCGSIQRPAAGSGALLPPDKYIACEKCGAPILEETGETVCEDCMESDKPRPVIVFEDTEKYKKAKTYAMAAGSVSLAAVVGCGIALAFVSGVWLIVLVGLGGAGVAVSGAILLISSRSSIGKIEYYAPIKPASSSATAAKPLQKR